MPPVIHPCPHCEQPAKLDTDQLPDQPVAYPCPRCKQNVTVEKAALLATLQPAAASQPQEPQQPQAQPEAATPPQAGTESIGLTPTPQAERRYGAIPDDAQLPSGIIFGDDSEVVQRIQSRLATVGSNLERMETIEAARQAILNEDPELCVFVTNGEVTPQNSPIAALQELPASARRHSYFSLVGDTLTTMDGSQAFLFQANLVISKDDLDHCEAAIHSGLEYHQRLYRPYRNAVERKHSVA